MDKDALRKAQAASRTAFLKKEGERRRKVAANVMEDKLKEIESGLVPSSVAEADFLLQRSEEVRTAEGLLQAARRRQELIGETTSLQDREEVEHVHREHERLIDENVNHVQQETTPHKQQEEADVSHQFVEMHEEEVRERVAKHDYVAEKTMDEIQHEKAAALQNFNDQLQAQRRSLPIYEVREALLRTIRENQVTVVVGETGCGKTTQLLQYLYEEGFHLPRSGEEKTAEGSKEEQLEEEEEEKRLICTQPRRLAAVSVAERVAVEMGCRCGSTVGYKVRFDDKTSPNSRVLFVTDGMMLKEFTSDPNMDTVGAIMIDEAHERSLSTDVLLGLLRDVMRRNKRIKIIVASATINADKFSSFFNNAPIFSIKGRTYPVETFYAEGPVADYVAESAQTALGLHLSKPLPGDILIFLPGQDAIEECAQQLRDYATEMSDTIQPLVILPIYAALPPKEQARIYEKTPPNSRKVVIATNIAETSITIDGVVYVIDCGLCKQNFYNPKAMAEELRVVPTSQASATQRAGRAGRTQAGECYRLFTAYTFKNELPPETIPEIMRCSMSAMVLQLKALGINNLLQFDFIDAPSTDSLERALDHLFLLGAMKADGRLTVTGRRMAEFPLDPSFSKCLIRACALGCGRHMAMAAAMLSLESVFIGTRDAKVKQQIESAKRQLFSFGNGDVTGYINLMEEWLRAGPRAADFCKTYCIHPRSLARARDVMDQILKTFDRIGLDVAKETDAEGLDAAAKAGSLINTESVTRALLSGFFFNVAKMELDKRTYRIVRPMDNGSTNKNGEVEPPTAELHPTSFLFRAGMSKTDPNGKQKDDSVPPILQERPHLVVFTELRHTTKRFMIHTTAIPQIEWVLESAPLNYFQREELEYGLRKRPRA